MLGCFALSMPTLPATATRERNWAILWGVWQQPPRISKGGMLSWVQSGTQSGAINFLLSWRRGKLAAGWDAPVLGKKTLWEGKRKAIDVSQGIRLKNRVRTDCLGLSVYRNSKWKQRDRCRGESSEAKYRRQDGKKGKGGGRKCCKKTISLFSTAVTYWSQCG